MKDDRANFRFQNISGLSLRMEYCKLLSTLGLLLFRALSICTITKGIERDSAAF
jgi:hypothetical protein